MRADEEALGWPNTVAANPEAKAVLSDLAGLAGVLGLPVGTIAGVGTGIKTVLSLYARPDSATQAPADQAVPAGSERGRNARGRTRGHHPRARP